MTLSVKELQLVVLLIHVQCYITCCSQFSSDQFRHFCADCSAFRHRTSPHSAHGQSQVWSKLTHWYNKFSYGLKGISVSMCFLHISIRTFYVFLHVLSTYFYTHPLHISIRISTYCYMQILHISIRIFYIFLYVFSTYFYKYFLQISIRTFYIFLCVFSTYFYTHFSHISICNF